MINLLFYYSCNCCKNKKNQRIYLCDIKNKKKKKDIPLIL